MYMCSTCGVGVHCNSCQLLDAGPEEVSFVADNGLELFNHSYGNILHCCIAVDGISFAYAARQEKDKYFCHVFQALTYEEVCGDHYDQYTLHVHL